MVLSVQLSTDLSFCNSIAFLGCIPNDGKGVSEVVKNPLEVVVSGGAISRGRR